MEMTNPAQPEEQTSTIANTEYANATRQDLLSRLRSVSSWFYWIAGLSVINTLLAIYSKDMYFIVGLGLTQVIDGIVMEAFGSYHIIGWILNAIVLGMFILFGIMFSKGHKWALICGMIVYTFDGLLFVFAEEWLSIAFHGYVLYKLFTGFSTLKELEAHPLQ